MRLGRNKKVTTIRPRNIRRVLMSADCIGGVFVYALELCRVFGQAGLELVLATMGRRLNDVQRAELAQLPHVVVEESELKVEWMDAPFDDVMRSCEWLLALEAKYRPDVVHLNTFAHGALPFSAPRIVVAHSCVLSWWEAVFREPAPDLWAQYRELVAAGIKGADTVVAPTRAMLASLAAHYGEPPHGRVISNGIEPFVCSRVKQPIVFAAGRLWDQGKNLASLDRAAELISWPVYVAGENISPDGRRITCRNAQSLGPLPRPQLIPWFARASIYALPARYEPFGLSVLEAALARSALVLGDIDSLRETWGADAMFVDPEDPAAIARAIAELIEDPRRRRALGSGARKRALNFTARRMAARYLELYEELARSDLAGSRSRCA
jgi:glycosyltransferase involved in cell wall biosynthesis